MNDRQRLEAIVAVVCKYLPPDGISREDAMREIIELVDPLPEQEKQEPVAWVTSTASGYNTIGYDSSVINQLSDETLLYTAPPRNPWVGLTQEERHAYTQSPFTEENYRAIEAKLKEKNT